MAGTPKKRPASSRQSAGKGPAKPGKPKASGRPGATRAPGGPKSPARAARKPGGAAPNKRPGRAPAGPRPQLVGGGEDRLQKIISEAGLASRRGAERLIEEGRVTVNGQVVTEQGLKADPARDRIAVDGRPLPPPQQLRYYMFHKPAGYLTTLSDPQ
ncbi:MAG: hypothetical protein LBV79_03675, partial [Candidatus Adiutrix sp.]|nr:hypothetical protein [Candidatus Adiutrix sp.]